MERIAARDMCHATAIAYMYRTLNAAFLIPSSFET
jgi:hypothetical protein